jgi:hypothetical protein
MRTELKSQLANYLLDISKLIVGGIVICGVISDDVPPVTIILGGVASLVTAITGFILILNK